MYIGSVNQLFPGATVTGINSGRGSLSVEINDPTHLTGHVCVDDSRDQEKYQSFVLSGRVSGEKTVSTNVLTVLAPDVKIRAAE